MSLNKKAIVDNVNEKVKQWESDLTDAQDLLNMLKQSGENTIELETKLNQAKTKLGRIKGAFKQ